MENYWNDLLHSKKWNEIKWIKDKNNLQKVVYMRVFWCEQQWESTCSLSFADVLEESMFKYYSTWTVARSSVRMCMPLASCTAVHVYNTVCTIRALNVKESLLQHCKGCARPHPLSHHAEELVEEEAFILAELAFQTSRRIQCFKASVWNFAFYSGGWCWKPLFFASWKTLKHFLTVYPNRQ